MKKLVLLPVMAGTLFASNASHREALVSEFKNMFERIGEKRIGVDEEKINSLHAPFVTVAKKSNPKPTQGTTKKSEPSFVLQAILDKSAKISGKWYQLHGKVNGMKIISIRDNYVWLKNDEFRKKLTLGSKNEKISIK